MTTHDAGQRAGWHRETLGTTIRRGGGCTIVAATKRADCDDNNEHADSGSGWKPTVRRVNRDPWSGGIHVPQTTLVMRNNSDRSWRISRRILMMIDGLLSVDSPRVRGK